jgi:hypothetical protein
MQTSAALDWQVFEEGEWERAVAAGVLTGEENPAQPAGGGDNAGPAFQLPLFPLAALVVALTFLWAIYAPWAARRVEAMPAQDEYTAQITTLQIKAQNGQLRLSDIQQISVQRKPLTILSDYFQFTYDPHDRAAVTAAAGGIDPLYRALRQAIGLGEPDRVIQIDVNPQVMAVRWQSSTRGVLIPSPDFLHVRANAAAATLFASLRTPLTRALLVEGLEQAPPRPQWGLLLDGLARWLQHCEAEPRTRRCSHRMATTSEAPGASAVRLVDLLSTEPEWIADTGLAARLQSAESLIAYVVDRYGVEKLPALLAGFHQHRSWQTLAPAVFGQSVEQFEQGWRATVQVRPLTAH